MPVPFPTDEEVRLDPPDAAEARIIAGGVAAAIAPDGGLTGLQRYMIEAVTESMTGFAFPAAPSRGSDRKRSPGRCIAATRRSGRAWCSSCCSCELVLNPLPEEVVGRVEAYARRAGRRRRDAARSRARLREWQPRARARSTSSAAATWRRGIRSTPSTLHTSRALDEAWEMRCDDPDLAARWDALGDCPEERSARGRAVLRRARGFAFPGLPGSAPPLLAQHDWVHVLADYGSTVEAEIEVFAFIARANDDPRAFSLLAMVISLFETGYLASGAGPVRVRPRPSVARRHAGSPRRRDAARRAGRRRTPAAPTSSTSTGSSTPTCRSTTFAPSSASRRSRSARSTAGSVGPWEPGGISPYQYETRQRGREAAGATTTPTVRRRVRSYARRGRSSLLRHG